MSIEKLVRKEVRLLKPYMPGQSIGDIKYKYGLKEVFNLSTNESVIGPSPVVQEALKSELNNINQYPDGSSLLLRKELSKKYNIDTDMFIITNGGDELLCLLGSCFLTAGDEIIMGEYGFSTYEIVGRLYGAKIVRIPLQEGFLDLNRMIAKVTENTKMIFLCNPHNPAGTIFTQKELKYFLEKLPPHTIIVLDEAYSDFVENTEYPDSIGLIKGNKHYIISLRTFSKIGGIAGLRIGFGIASKEFINCLRKIQPPYSVNRLAQAAARAFLSENNYQKKLLQNNKQGKLYLYQQLNRLNLFYYPTEANFIFVDLKKDADLMCTKLMQNGIIVRSGKIWGKNTWVRITIGTPSQNQRLVSVLKQIL
jgi:histidinol-phosphate aminotransferase